MGVQLKNETLEASGRDLRDDPVPVPHLWIEGQRCNVRAGLAQHKLVVVAIDDPADNEEWMIEHNSKRLQHTVGKQVELYVSSGPH